MQSLHFLRKKLKSNHFLLFVKNSFIYDSQIGNWGNRLEINISINISLIKKIYYIKETLKKLIIELKKKRK